MEPSESGRAGTPQRGPDRRSGPGLGALAAYAGGAITAAGALGIGVLFGQVVIARHTIPGAEAPPPLCSGMYGARYAGEPVLRLALLGDSTAAGYGVTTREQTPGALLSTWVADAARRPVRLTCPAVVGSVSAWLPGQVETAVEAGVDLAIILIGANDVTTRASESTAVGYLADAVTQLRAAGAEVVVATCPDLGTIRPILPPLRWLARRWSRRLAEAQTIAVVRAGGRTVSLADLLGPQFDAAPDRMFGQDRFHPSPEGYVTAAKVILPAVLDALGLAPQRPAAKRRRPLSEAAATAVTAPGREVVAGNVTDSAPGSAVARQPNTRQPNARQPNGSNAEPARASRRGGLPRLRRSTKDLLDAPRPELGQVPPGGRPAGATDAHFELEEQVPSGGMTGAAAPPTAE